MNDENTVQPITLHDLWITDMNRNNYYRWREPRKSGPFRSVQVFECEICGFQTNLGEFAVGSFFGCRRIAYHHDCPHAYQDWHRTLREKLKLSREQHPASYLVELQSEIDEIRRQHPLEHDLVGGPLDIRHPIEFLSASDQPRIGSSP